MMEITKANIILKKYKDLEQISYHAIMSSTAAALILINPTVVFMSFVSDKILASTGKA